MKIPFCDVNASVPAPRDDQDFGASLDGTAPDALCAGVLRVEEVPAIWRDDRLRPPSGLSASEFRRSRASSRFDSLPFDPMRSRSTGHRVTNSANVVESVGESPV